MRQVNEIVIHCTDTQPNWWSSKSTKEKVAEVRRWHTSAPRNWSDIGYHYLIDRDGTIIEGRPLDRVGAHVKGHNTGTIGISLFGGHGSSAGDSFEDHFTEEQDRALRGLIGQLRQQFPEITKVTGHNQYAAKACPGFPVPAWIAKEGAVPVAPLVRSEQRTSPAQSRTMQASLVAAASASGTAITALSALDSVAQYIVLCFAGVVVLMAVWIMKERLRKWAAGDR